MTEYRPTFAKEITAATLIREAHNHEHDVTEMLKGLQADGATLAGLEFRVKGFESTVRKLSSESPDYEMNDVLRYTYECRLDELTKHFYHVQAAVEMFDCRMVKVKNTFPETRKAYRGLNTVIQCPDGYRFELQFHTKESLIIKEINHKDYEVSRLDTTSEEERKILDEIMADRSETIPMPLNVESIKDRAIPRSFSLSGGVIS